MTAAAMRLHAQTGSTDSSRRRTRVLDPGERTAEVLFGLIMVLTFTGSLSVAHAGREDVRAMLIGALGCNIAWGIIDAVLHLMARLAGLDLTERWADWNRAPLRATSRVIVVIARRD